VAGRWLELSIRASAEAAEALTPVFDRVGHGGVVVEPELCPQQDETDPVLPVPGQFAVLRTYLPESADTAARRKSVEDAVGVLRAFDLAPMGDLQCRWIDEDDWANAWKQHYAVLRIGRRWVIKPSWQAYDARPGDRVIELDPGMAFGTGQHPTTQLVLVLLEALDARGRVAGGRILDLGTGSGVLAIAAARAGAAAVLALDVDDVATRAAAENVRRNGDAATIDVRHATLGAGVDGVVPAAGLRYEAAFDGAFANIVARVIAERAPALAAALRPGGWLIASGIIAEREAEAAGALAASGFVVDERRQQGDWVALVSHRVASSTPGVG
jgi:ribosomal protein L11 methyltransferase